MTTLTAALRAATRALASAGVPDPEVDARILLLAAAGLDRLALILDPGRALPRDATERLDGFVARRAAREPVSRILGRRDFWGLTLRVTPDVLDPRPDTETVVAAVLDALGPRRGEPLRLLDLGTGSGAILCALLSELPRASGWAVDRSAAACAVARGNLDACGLAPRSLVVQGDWAVALAGGFDTVVSNPPYIESAIIPELDRDVREHDPLAALDGGADGLDCYRVLAADLPRLLAKGGVACFEVGRGQDGDVAGLMRAAGLADVATRADLGGVERAVLGRQAAGMRPSA
ncbi:peptide chain release factor N(5)-glutamine methyltransferase [Lichenibacterium dinghuense]|uniref:peptide chain release factor N(5)-glutamine methyltransferase n=1 Tax=Lichenibacterium dinghuense TaxID=2895977 RepID=UPI001F02E8C1|nr:peptide chain release factor N(5)-glutamine methyltransferase [Lichenibacterium sp. 6Y81]